MFRCGINYQRIGGVVRHTHTQFFSCQFNFCFTAYTQTSALRLFWRPRISRWCHRRYGSLFMIGLLVCTCSWLLPQSLPTQLLPRFTPSTNLACIPYRVAGYVRVRRCRHVVTRGGVLRFWALFFPSEILIFRSVPWCFVFVCYSAWRQWRRDTRRNGLQHCQCQTVCTQGATFTGHHVACQTVYPLE